MSPQLRSLADLSLHDWQVIQSPAEAWQVIAGSRGVNLRVWESFLLLPLRKGNDVRLLLYALWDKLRVVAAGPQWRRKRSDTKPVYWLYDEVDRVPSPSDRYIHRVFLSDGTVRVIRFATCHVFRLSAARDSNGLGDRRRKSA